MQCQCPAVCRRASCVCAVVNEAPFRVVESGYGGFLLPVDIYLRTTCEPRRLRFLYDLELDSSCSVACVRYEKLVFINPAESLQAALSRSHAVSYLFITHSLISILTGLASILVLILLYTFLLCSITHATGIRSWDMDGDQLFVRDFVFVRTVEGKLIELSRTKSAEM